MELLGKSKNELREFCAALGEPAYRGAQMYHALYAERKFAFARMTNLPAALRERLAAQARITLPAVRQRYTSQDGSVRYLLVLPAGEGKMDPRAALVEAVFMQRGAADDLHLDAGGLRGGLSVLLDCATRVNRQFDCRRDSGSGALTP